MNHRMKGRHTLRTGTAVLAVAGLMLAASAADARPGHHGGHDSLARLERGLEALGLETQTLEAARALLDDSRDERRALRARIGEAHRELRALLEHEAPDAEAVLGQAEAIGSLQTEARKQRLKTRLELEALLTPDQREQLRETAHARLQRGKGKHKGCGEGRSSD